MGDVVKGLHAAHLELSRARVVHGVIPFRVLRVERTVCQRPGLAVHLGHRSCRAVGDQQQHCSEQTTAEEFLVPLLDYHCDYSTSGPVIEKGKRGLF